MIHPARAAVLALSVTLAAPAHAGDPAAKPGAPAAATPKPAKPPPPATAAKAPAPAASAPAAAASAPAAAPAAKPIAAADWKEFQAQDAGFAARFPGTPERNEGPAGPMTLVAYAVGLEAPAPSFAVMVMSAPPEAGDLPPEMLEQVADGIAEKLGKNVTRNAAAKAAGRPARDLAASGEEGSVAVRLVLVGGRLYQIMALAKGPLAAADVATFFDSFRVLP